MKLAIDNVAIDDTVIVMVDEWGTGNKNSFDATVLFKNDKGIDVLYLSGYRSRNDFVEWSDVIAKVDMNQPITKVAKGSFSGHFMVFGED